MRTAEGKRAYQVINDPQSEQSIEINYRPHELNVKVEAGVNSSIAKQAALQQIVNMMQASPLFAQFINTMGLETILDNMDIRGIDSLKQKSVEFMQQLQQQQEAAANQPKPEEEMIKAAMEVEMAKVEQKADESEGKLAIETARVAIEQEKVNAQIMEIMNDMEAKNAKLVLDQEKVDSENARTAIETAMAIASDIHDRQTERNEE